MARKARSRKPASLEVRGWLDRAEPDGMLQGWCWWPEQPSSRRVVEIMVDGVPAALVRCDQLRFDLVDAQVGDGRHAFSFVVPSAAATPGHTAEIGLRDLESQLQVGDVLAVTWAAAVQPAAEQRQPEPEPEPQPEPEPEPARLAGNLDRVTRDGWVSGWCWSPAAPQLRVTLAIWVDDQAVGSTVAAIFRADLQDAGIGDGGHGFSYALPYEVLAERGRMLVSVRDAVTGEALGQPVDLRLGRMAQTEQRVIGLERQVRLLRGQIEDMERRGQAQPQADTTATSALFGTVAAFFKELAEGTQGDARGFGLGPGLRGTRDDLALRLPALALREPAAPRATLCVPATAPTEAVHRCLVALHDVGVDAVADIVLLDPGGADARTALLPSLVRNLRYLRVTGTLASAVAAAWRDGRAALGGVVSPQLRVARGWLGALADTLERQPPAALVAGIVLRPDGAVADAGLSLLPGAMLREAATVAADHPRMRFMRRADAVAASGFVVERAAFLAAGGFPEGYASLDHATVALCLRLRDAGRGVLVQPAAAALLAPGTTPPVPDLSAPDEDARALRLAALQFLAADPAGRPGAASTGHALVVDDEAPRPDRDAGSISALEHMRVLIGLGWEVTFAAGGGGVAAEADLALLEALGIEVAQPPHFDSVTHYLREHGGGLDLVQVYRYRNAEMLLPRLRELAPQAKLVFVPADLHFLRAEREAAVTGRGDGHEADAARAAELACIAAADATLLFSDHERDLIASETDASRLHLLRWVARPRLAVPEFAARSGMLFVGSFTHAPNIDAVEWMAAAVLPALRRVRPNIVLHVVGSDPPASLRALACADIVIHGWVPEMTGLWDSVRLSVAPLRFGAGFKGKVATSLAQGVPVVGTATALEGTGLSPGDGVVAAHEPEAFAHEIARVHDDAEAWAALSRAGLERVSALYSPEAARAVYRTMLTGLGLPPGLD